MPDQCPLCTRPKEPPAEFCNLHNTASKNLEAAYSPWNKAYGGKLTRKEYFARLKALDETGGAVKEVIQHLSAKGEA